MDDIYSGQPRYELSDEAAAEILDLLYEFIADFESAYAHQIRRHRQAEARCYRDLRQQALFDEPDLDPDPDPDRDPF